MTRFQNGRIPAGVLQTIATGTDSNGYWEFQISAHTLWMWNTAKAYAEQHFGKTLHIRTGWNCYRPYDVQVAAKNRAIADGTPNAAASPGYSSHGGTWIDNQFTGGRWVDAMAIDVDPNGLTWPQVWEACTAAGFLCNAITIARAGIPEPWHIIDLHPWDAVPNNVGPVVPFPNPKPQPVTPPKPGRDQRRSQEMIAAAYRDPNGTIAVQARLGGALTLIPDITEWSAIAGATGVQAYQVDTLDALRAEFAEVPHPLYDDGRASLRILQPATGTGNPASRYGALGNRAWPLDLPKLAALQKAGAEIVSMPQADIDSIVIH